MNQNQISVYSNILSRLLEALRDDDKELVMYYEDMLKEVLIDHRVLGDLDETLDAYENARNQDD